MASLATTAPVTFVTGNRSRVYTSICQPADGIHQAAGPAAR
jgi:hypothetical protein